MRVKIIHFVFTTIIILMLTACNSDDEVIYTKQKLDISISGYDVYSVYIESYPDDFNVCQGFHELKIVESDTTYRCFHEDCMETGYKVEVGGELLFLSDAINQGYITEERILETDLGITREID